MDGAGFNLYDQLKDLFIVHSMRRCYIYVVLGKDVVYLRGIVENPCSL